MLSVWLKANELEPNTDMYEDTYAWIYFQKGDLENAEYWIKKHCITTKKPVRKY